MMQKLRYSWIILVILSFLLVTNLSYADDLDFEDCNSVADWTRTGISSDAVTTYIGNTCKYDKASDTSAYRQFTGVVNGDRMNVSFA